MLFREHLCARFWHRLGLQSCWGSRVSQPCPTVLHRAFLWYWPVHPDSYGFAFYALHMPCIAFCLAVPKMLFREHLCARFWHRLGLQSCWGSGVSQPCLPVLHKAFPWYWPVHPDIYGFALYAVYIHPDIYGFAFVVYLAVPKMLFREHLCARFWHRLGLQSCWGSGVSQTCIIVLHRAFPWYWPVHPDIYGFALYAVYPSRHLWLCLVCRVYVCLVYVCIALLLVVYCLVTILLYILPCPCMYCSSNLAVPKILFREHLCARFWRDLRLQSCWGSGVSQPCPTVLHRAFPWYWPVHPDIYDFAFYAFYALHCLLFSSSEDAISKASLRTLLAPPWASILLGIRCFATALHTFLAPPWIQ